MLLGAVTAGGTFYVLWLTDFRGVRELGFIAGTAIDIVHGHEPLSWLFNSAKLRHIVTGALVFAFLYVLLFALITKLRNREYAALTARQTPGSRIWRRLKKVRLATRKAVSFLLEATRVELPWPVRG